MLTNDVVSFKQLGPGYLLSNEKKNTFGVE